MNHAAIDIDVTDDLTLLLSTEGLGHLRIQMTVDVAIALADKLLTAAAKTTQKIRKAGTN